VFLQGAVDYMASEQGGIHCKVGSQVQCYWCLLQKCPVEARDATSDRTEW